MSIANYAKKGVLDNASTAKNARMKIAELEFKKTDVAMSMDILPTVLSGLLNGSRMWTDDFVAKFDSVVAGRGQ